MGIRDHPISPGSPWQNPYAERLIGTLRRDCLDHVLIFGERHLRGVLSLYSLYYNETRTHLGIGQGRPTKTSRTAIGGYRHRVSLVRIASSLRADMIFGKDTGWNFRKGQPSAPVSGPTAEP
jgi:transposase InsO family protein